MGYDFILDESLNVWLIEVNTNPCIEESSPLLAMLLPRMLGKYSINKKKIYLLLIKFLKRILKK
jgi:D-alanine-D-alanine ligase-like ATP-grasp enzyme